MKKNCKYLLNTLMLYFMLLLGSCRSSDTDHIIDGGGVVAVNFNLSGTEYSNTDNSSNARTASVNKISNLAVGNLIQRNSVLIDPSTVLVAEIAPSVTSLKTSASTSPSINPLAISGEPLPIGAKFRIIAYRSNGNYHTYQDYTVGQAATPMMLDNGALYNIVVYSYGTSYLPPISAGEQNNISSAQVNYNDSNRDFMYQKVNFTPVNTENTLNITLRHKVAQITTILNSGGIGTINSVGAGLLTAHYAGGVYSLNTGTMISRSNLSSGAVLNFPGPFPAMTQTAIPVFVNNDTGGNLTGGFSANVTIGGDTKTISLPNSFKITPENKSNLTIGFQRCGAYINPYWRDFMCHNLGADTSADPFTPSAAIHGGKYQWGITSYDTDRYISQAVDQSTPGAITGWNTAPKTYEQWDNTDICPAGYVVPTLAEWQGLNNSQFNPKSVIGANWTESATNFSTGLMYGTGLFLPAAGLRWPNNGMLSYRGRSGEYWTKTSNRSQSPAYSNFINIYQDNFSVSLGERTYGLSIKCIKPLQFN